MTTLSRPKTAENTLAPKLIAVGPASMPPLSWVDCTMSGHLLVRPVELRQRRADELDRRPGERGGRERDVVLAGGPQHGLERRPVEGVRAPVAQAMLARGRDVRRHVTGAVLHEGAVKHVFRDV